MSGVSGIEWCDATWEVTAGCTHVSSGCANCYAESLVSTRLAGMALNRKRSGAANGSALDLSLEVVDPKRGRWNGQIRLLEMNLGAPMRRRAPTVYFVNSRSDLFHEDVPFAYIDRVFAVMAMCPQHRFLVLTKRPERMRVYLSEGPSRLLRWYQSQLESRASDTRPFDFFDSAIASDGFLEEMSCDITPIIEKRSLKAGWPLPNVWLGTSCEDQAAADARIPELLACPASGRFVSAEPLLDSVDLTRIWMGGDPPTDDDGGDVLNALRFDYHTEDGDEYCGGLDWVIVGGESGKRARACHLDWIRSIVADCQQYGTPVYVKQLGKFTTCDQADWDEMKSHTQGSLSVSGGARGQHIEAWPEDLRVRELPVGIAEVMDPESIGGAS